MRHQRMDYISGDDAGGRHDAAARAGDNNGEALTFNEHAAGADQHAAFVTPGSGST